MRFELLGPVRAWRGDIPLKLGPSQRRAILAVLLLHANQPLSREQLIDGVWGVEAPTYAANLLQKHISALRRELEPTRLGRAPSDVLVWTDAGYLLTVPDGDVDLQVYRVEVANARTARANGDLQKAAKALHRALGLWRGQAFHGLTSPLLDSHRHRLAEQRIDILADRIDLDLALGGEPDLVAELRQLVADHPLHDRLSALLMLALYRSGRRAEALRVFHNVRRQTRDELGIDPSAHLQALHQQMLAADPALDAPQTPRLAPGPPSIGSGAGHTEPTQKQTPSSPRIDVTVPHPGRMYDYWLGGRHNFAADREIAEAIMKLMPGIEEVSRLNQSFLRRAALFMVNSGIRQFIDLGSGIPTVRHLHEIIQRAEPGCRIVYVERDPVAVAHSALLFEPVEGTAVIHTSIGTPNNVLDAEATCSLLDITQPIGLIMPALHFIPDAHNPAAIVAAYRDRIASGSYVALAHATADTPFHGMVAVIEAYKRTRRHVFPRTHSQIMHICAGLELVSPGLVGYALWRPDRPGDLSSNPAINSIIYAAVGRKP